MSSRLSVVIDRTRVLNAIPEDDLSRAHLRVDLERLRRRADLLSAGILSSLRGGLCATLLLAIIFLTEFIGFKYAYGAGLLFVVATYFLGVGLFRFAQEAKISVSSADEHL
ncbi:hypothetical protein PSHI_03200 [Pseudomonas sp. URMO17WK12:I11]|jgi:hypothetical protein|nr:hypothetical protein PSHI_03200 [Pseudomonas sp. URMO17WK12:I11]